MTRNPQWPHLLTHFVEDRRHVPFSWGGQDCCLFAADWVQLCTGEDPAARWRGTYSTMLGAVRHVTRAGGVCRLPEAAGLVPVEPQFAGRGDIAGVATSLGLALGICLGRHIVTPGHDGLVFQTRIMVRNAWRV